MDFVSLGENGAASKKGDIWRHLAPSENESRYKALDAWKLRATVAGGLRPVFATCHA
jgi:hypothetical protein